MAHENPDTPHAPADILTYLYAHGLTTAASNNSAPADRPPDVVVFWLANRCYWVPRQVVRTILPLASYTPLPLMPAWILGAVAINNQMIGVVDIRALEHQRPAPPAPEALVLIVELDDLTLGVLADSVEPPDDPLSGPFHARG